VGQGPQLTLRHTDVLALLDAEDDVFEARRGRRHRGDEAPAGRGRRIEPDAGAWRRSSSATEAGSVGRSCGAAAPIS
jgi:hypothetical protein